ncbi:MAG: vWA domain-containing protein [Gemmataceae bacterium]
MQQPQIDLIPIRGAVRSDDPITLDVLIRVTPPRPNGEMKRPTVNLGLVIDRSGSMGGGGGSSRLSPRGDSSHHGSMGDSLSKMSCARAAAIFAVEQLLPTDRVSVTIFDDHVETIVPNTLAENKGRIVELIQGVHSRGSTALHGGWEEGARQVQQHFVPAGLNRVLLLSDGLANVGETNPDTIATHVHRLAQEGVSTTTMGVGNDYNEDLMEAMARSGDGNYYYIEAPRQIADIFQSELQGLMTTFGHTVSLGIEPQHKVILADVLNELDRLPTGRLKLPNLVAEMPLHILVRLNVPPMAGESELCRFRLAWNAPKQPQRQIMTVSLQLPAVGKDTWELLAPVTEVQEQVVLLLIARHKKQATQCLERQDRDGAACGLQEAMQLLASAPDTPEMRREARALAEIEGYLESGACQRFLKHAKYQAHQRWRSEQYRTP